MNVSQSGMEAISKRINDMRDQTRKLRQDVPQTFFDWQKDDLHSENPWVKRVGGRGRRARIRHYRTIILPHSAKSLEYRKRVAMRLRRRRIKSRRTGTTKPILRPRLETQLWEQLTVMLDNIRW